MRALNDPEHKKNDEVRSKSDPAVKRDLTIEEWVGSVK